MLGVFFDGTLSLLTHFVGNQPSFGSFFYRLWPAAFDVVLSRQQAQARRWWMGSLKFAIGSEPPFLRILPAAFTSSFRYPYCPRAAGSESLKCFCFILIHFRGFRYDWVWFFFFFSKKPLFEKSFFSYLLLEEPSFFVKEFFRRRRFQTSFYKRSSIFPTFLVPPYFLRTLENLL